MMGASVRRAPKNALSSVKLPDQLGRHALLI